MEAFGIVVGLVWTRLGAWVVGHSVGMEEILCVLSALIARRPARWRVIHDTTPPHEVSVRFRDAVAVCAVATSGESVSGYVTLRLARLRSGRDSGGVMYRN